MDARIAGQQALQAFTSQELRSPRRGRRRQHFISSRPNTRLPVTRIAARGRQLQEVP